MHVCLRVRVRVHVWRERQGERGREDKINFLGSYFASIDVVKKINFKTYLLGTNSQLYIAGNDQFGQRRLPQVNMALSKVG